ncbi:MAG: hypothetical protein U0798_03990 [Gemmataceae bacterium]
MNNQKLGNRRYLWQAGSGPTVVFLHGTGGAVEWVDSEIHMAHFAKVNGWTLAYPAGLPPDPRKPMGFLSNPNRWNDGSTSEIDPHHSTSDDVAFLDAVFDDLVRHGSDPARLVLAGFSNGAGMTFRFAAEGRTRLAAIICVAGHCWIDPAPLARPVSTLYMIGDHDPLIPVAGGEVRIPWGNRVVTRPPVSHSLAKWARANQCDPNPVTSVDASGLMVSHYAGAVPGVTFRSVVIPGLGHHWPGGAGQLNPRLGGPKHSPILANQWIQSFLREQGVG